MPDDGHTRPALSIEGVRFAYRGAPILAGVDLAVRRGEVLALVGPNGCGKSTALRVMAGLLPPDAGAVRVGERDLRALSRRALARALSLLTQSGTAPADMTVHDMIAMGRFAHQSFLRRRSTEDEARIAEAVLAMQVQSLQDRRVGELSGGQLQRCRMAMVLAQGSDILLLDEPTTYLDLKYQFAILDVIRAQAAAGKAVVVVVHDFTQASLYADRIAALHGGRVVAVGPPEEVLTEDRVAEVFDVRTRAVRAHGAVFHVPRARAR